MIWAKKKKKTEEPKEQTVTMHMGCDDSRGGKGSVKVQDQHIWFYQDVYPDAVQDLADSMHDVAMASRVDQVRFDLDAPIPIHLHIHSYGGDVFSALALADMIRSLKVPVYTHIEGAVASAATILSVVGAKRTIGRHGFVLIHQISTGFWGKFEELKDEMENTQRIMDALSTIYTEYTKITPDHLQELLKRDLWLSAEKALELGIVDEIR